MITQIKKYNLGEVRAQSTLEYAVVVACVVAAILAMQIYIKRGTQGRLRQASDEIGEQYSPTATTSSITTNLGSEVIIKQKMVPLNDSKDNPVNGMQSDVEIKETTTKSGKESVGAFENGLF